MIRVSKIETGRRQLSFWLRRVLPDVKLPSFIKKAGYKLADALVPERDKIEMRLKVKAAAEAIKVAKKQSQKTLNRSPVLKWWFCESIVTKVDGGWLTVADAINSAKAMLSEDGFLRLFERFVTRPETFNALVVYLATLYKRVDEIHSDAINTKNGISVRSQILVDMAVIICKNEQRGTIKSIKQELVDIF